MQTYIYIYIHMQICVHLCASYMEASKNQDILKNVAPGHYPAQDSTRGLFGVATLINLISRFMLNGARRPRRIQIPL